MKIALVILHANPARGGAERYTIDLAAALCGRRHDVSLVASSFEGEPLAQDVQLAVSGSTRSGRYSSFIERLDRHLDEVKYDIVHAMLPVPRCDVYHPHAGIALEAVEAGHLKHESPLKRAMSKVATRLNARRQRFAAVEKKLLTGNRQPVVLCLSEYIKGVVRKHYSLSGEKLATLFNAVDLKKFDPGSRPHAGAELRRKAGIAEDKIVALTIAQDFERKGLREAISALAATNDPRLMLVVVGKQEPRIYRDWAATRGLADRVIFAGPTNDPYSYYRAADFFVLPTRHDPCSLVVLEALAMGVPVISTVFNGACEMMTDGTHGFVLKDPADVPALSAAIGRMLDEGAREAMSKACLELRTALSYERHLDRLLDVYETVRQS